MRTSIVSIVFLSIFLGFTPAIFYAWLFFLRRKRKFQRGKQPTALLILMFFGGIAAVVVSYFSERYLINFLPSSFAACVANSPLCRTDSPATILILAVATFLIVGPIEEGAKFLAVFGISYKSPQFTRIIDGAKFGVAAALGFASAENALYLFSNLRILDLNTFVSTFLLRFALSSPAHLFYSGLFGYYLGRAQFQRYGRVRTIALGLFLAILTHGLYDFVLFSKVGFYAIFVLVALFTALYVRFRAPENFAIRIPEFMRRRGILPQHIYRIPVETELSPANAGVGKVLAEIPAEMRPITPNIKPEYLPAEVPSEFAVQQPTETVRRDLKVPQETAPARREFVTRTITPRRVIAPRVKPLGSVPSRKPAQPSDTPADKMSVSGAAQIVRSSVDEVKRRRLQLMPQ